MKNWIIIILSLVCITVVIFLGVKAYCHYLELNVAYNNPIIKYHKVEKKSSTVVLKTDTRVSVSSGDMKLLPDGSYLLTNCTNIVFTSTTASTTVAKNHIVENGSSKPDLSGIKPVDDFIISLSYIHVNHEPDIQALTVYKKVFCNLYVGVGVYIRMDVFAEDYLPKWEWQNIAVGISFKF